MNNSIETKVENKPISPTLKAMDKDTMVEIPLVQYDSVATTIFRIQTATEMRFSISKNTETKMVEVTRII